MKRPAREAARKARWYLARQSAPRPVWSLGLCRKYLRTQNQCGSRSSAWTRPRGGGVGRRESASDGGYLGRGGWGGEGGGELPEATEVESGGLSRQQESRAVACRVQPSKAAAASHGSGVRKR